MSRQASTGQARDELAVQEAYFKGLKPVEAAKAKPKPMEFMTRAQARELTVAGHKVAGLIPNSGVGQIYGDSGCGKSFTLMTLCHCLSEGWDFCGRAVKKCAVYYFHLEGVGGLPKRLAAFDRWMEEAQKPPLSGRLFYRVQDFSITDADMAALAEAILANGDEGAFIVIDTQAQATAGMKENDATDMGEMLKRARSLAKAVNGVVCLVHHTGKDPSLGGRGSSVQRADFDFQIEAGRDKGNERSIYWNSKKERDESDSQQFQFVLKVYENLVQDEDGNWQSSCVAVPVSELPDEEQDALRSAEQQRVRDRTPTSLQIAMQALEEAIFEEQKTNPDAESVSETHFREVFYRRYPYSSEDPQAAKEAKRKAFSRATKDLVAKCMACHDNGFWSQMLIVKPRPKSEPRRGGQNGTHL